MSDGFLSSLIDTTGDSYAFGKIEIPPNSIFLFKNDSVVETSSSKYTDIYKGHSLKPMHHNPLMRKNVAPDWFFPFILIVLAFFAWLRVYYNRYFFQMIQAFVKSNLANQIVRDENILVQRASVYLSMIYNLVAALLLFIVSMRYEWSMLGIGTGFSRFIFFLILVTSAYALKFLLLKICGWLFEQEREMAAYIFNIFLINNILGILLLPVICLLAYNETLATSWIIAIPIVLVLLAFGWRIVRGVQIALGISPFSPLYIFLYLCTLEIAPLMVLIRIVVQ